MRKFFVPVFLGCLIAGSAFAAPDRSERAEAGVNVWGVLPTDGDMGENVYVGGVFNYGINRNWAVGFEGGYFQTNVDLTVPAANASDIGDLNGAPLMVNLIYRHPVDGVQWEPYAVLGIGAILWHFDENQSIPEAGSSIDVDNSFAVKLGLGLDWFLTDNTALNLEAAYVYSDADITAKSPSGEITDTTDTSFITIGGGLKYVFL